MLKHAVTPIKIGTNKTSSTSFGDVLFQIRKNKADIEMQKDY